jgi:hypothetical protein
LRRYIIQGPSGCTVPCMTCGQSAWGDGMAEHLPASGAAPSIVLLETFIITSTTPHVPGVAATCRPTPMATTLPQQLPSRLLAPPSARQPLHSSSSAAPHLHHQDVEHLQFAAAPLAKPKLDLHPAWCCRASTGATMHAHA